MAAMHNGAATMAGDPAKVAQVVLQIAEMDEPPLRLLLGSDAYTYATADERWRDLSTSTDHDDATAADLDPLGEGAATASR